MSKQTKTIVIVLVAVVLLGVVYITFFNTNNDSSAVSGNGTTASAAEVSFLNLAAKINPIVFDTSILSDPRYYS
jgi:flagellar basal body-associated protein FliL